MGVAAEDFFLIHTRRLGKYDKDFLRKLFLIHTRWLGIRMRISRRNFFLNNLQETFPNPNEVGIYPRRFFERIPGGLLRAPWKWRAVSELCRKGGCLWLFRDYWSQEGAVSA